jgi:hypothetical protein
LNVTIKSSPYEKIHRCQHNITTTIVAGAKGSVLLDDFPITANYTISGNYSF